MKGALGDDPQRRIVTISKGSEGQGCPSAQKGLQACISGASNSANGLAEGIPTAMMA